MKQMYHINYIIILVSVLFLSCGSGKNTASSERADAISKMNESNISLLNQIRRLKGVTVQGGVPILLLGSNSVTGNLEPLYVVNSYIVGSRFAQVEHIVNPIDVESIKILKGSAASFYGSRAANGVILITTKL